MNRRTGVLYEPWPRPEHQSSVSPASRDGRASAAWPLTDALTLGALTTAVGSARMHARMVLSEWAMADMAEDTTLIVSELVTNAVLASTDPHGRPRYMEGHSGLPVVHLKLSSDRVQLVVEVWDFSPQAPIMGQPEQDAENGHGLFLVKAFSEQWGWAQVTDRPGKVVWAQLHVK